MRRNVRPGPAAVLIAIGLTLTACSSSSGDATSTDQGAGKPSVASLAKKSTAAQPTSTAERPRERIDMTDQESEALMKPYQDCMFENGVDIRSSRGQQAAKERSSSDISPATSKDEEKWAQAESACSQYVPLPAWEKDPANPEARDFARAVVACLKQKGVRYVEISSDGMSYAFGGEDNDARSISLGLEKSPECEREVAADMK